MRQIFARSPCRNLPSSGVGSLRPALNLFRGVDDEQKRMLPSSCKKVLDVLGFLFYLLCVYREVLRASYDR